MSSNSIHLHRVLKTSAEKVYKAFLDPDGLARWLPPNGFTARVLELEPVVGGKHRISFTNFGTGSTSSFGGSYRELKPAERIVYTDRFDDPGLPGEMVVTVDLKPCMVGVELHIVQEGIPASIPVAACYLGWQESLEQLARLVEPEIPD